MARMLMALIALSWGAAHADEPRDVVERYDAAIVSQQWERAMEQVRPADVANLRTFVVQQVSRPYSTERQVCFGNALPEDIAKMSDVTVGSCLFKAAMSQPGMSIKEHTLEIIGSVTEDPDTVHFVVRSTVTVVGRTTSRMDVVTAVREGGTWRVKLPQTVAAPANSVSAGSSQGPGPRPAPPPPAPPARR